MKNPDLLTDSIVNQNLEPRTLKFCRCDFDTLCTPNWNIEVKMDRWMNRYLKIERLLVQKMYIFLEAVVFVTNS